MKRIEKFIILWLLILVATVILYKVPKWNEQRQQSWMKAWADTFTTRMSLTKPSVGSTNWGTNMNNNLDSIDTLFGGSMSGQTLTDGSPISWNLSSAITATYSVTLNHTTGTRALNISNPVNGGVYTLEIKQDSTGGAAMTLGTGCTWKVGGGGSGAITLTTTASAIDVLTFMYDGTNCLANFQANFN